MISKVTPGCKASRVVQVYSQRDDVPRRWCSNRVESAKKAVTLTMSIGVAVQLCLAGSGLTQELSFPHDSVPGCSPDSSCVSTSSIMSPRSFMPPWIFGPLPQEEAYRQLMLELGRLEAVIIEADEQAGFVAAEVPVTVGRAGHTYDEVQFIFREGQYVLFRSKSKESRPDPPFCLTPGCINGPANRTRMAALRDALGWSNLETDEDKQWQQLLLH
mmetsp:Transcript_32648/g.72115  ORF Transcript_32648/g.72115 Transcript_32648/m.72115 type:complete len:216 (+) Transcript_32648:195-842(+)